MHKAVDICKRLLLSGPEKPMRSRMRVLHSEKGGGVDPRPKSSTGSTDNTGKGGARPATGCRWAATHRRRGGVRKA